MPRVIAIDFGLKRTGLAVTDPLRIIATALDTVGSVKLMDYLKAYVAKEQVDGFVIGLPTNLDGSATDITANVHAFVLALRATFPDKFVETMDERFTSRMAQQTLMESGKGRMARREKGQVDRIKRHHHPTELDEQGLTPALPICQPRITGTVVDLRGNAC